jgi:energy-coupling factor transport system substrate-specific component
MLGALMFCSKIIMEALPNIHLLGMLTMVFTVTFGWRALIPIYIYVFLNGLFAGFNVWWIPYLYIWTVLWAITMILPKKMPQWLRYVVYPLICSLHGFAFGILYAPAQAIFFGLDFAETIAWISTGTVFDIVHGISNFAAGLLIVPFSELLQKLSKRYRLI